MGNPSTPDHPQQIGPYRILEVIGEGGMGIVYKAEQKEPVRRLVAVKVVQAGLATREVLARFQLERRALAAMSHRCIAKVLDAGSTGQGEPFFVMELVEGLAITHYCNKHRLGIDDRLRLFQQVCDGVQHAHLKGVVHRDLKPGNVLVAREGADAVPKIVDFGLAKATNRDFLDATLFTEKDRVLGTPEYMSPEQAAGDGEVIDARSDVYSLGVILYELLSGELPFPTAALRKAGALEALRMIREQDPPKPSACLLASGDARQVADQRRTSTASLRNALIGDLDWIVLQAMAKEPERRYDAATALAADVGRYLQHLPVLAGPPSTSYRLRKFVQRHRVPLVAAAAVLLAIVAGGITAAAGFSAALANEQIANNRAEENRKLAQSESATKERLAGLLREFDQLAGVVLHTRVIARAAELYPPWPDKIAALQRWIDDSSTLLAKQPEIERSLRDLRARARPQSPAELEADRRSHPRLAERDHLAAKVAAMRRAHEVRSGRAAVAEPPLPAEKRGQAALDLNNGAWPAVDPDRDDGAWGNEAVALACARGVVAGANGLTKAFCCRTLAWALFANGRDAEAVAAAEQAVALAPNDPRGDFEGSLTRLREQIAAASGDAGARALAAIEAELAHLNETVQERRTWTFELESEQFLHDALTTLHTNLTALARTEQPAVERRLRWARQVAQLTLQHPRARHSWAEARAAIAKADGIIASTAYAGLPIELRDDDVVGLVPLGMNPVTRLWEFYDLRSAWDGDSDPTTLAIPEHRADGSIEVRPGTGIVFVLLPGGTVSLGSQNSDEHAPLFDPVHLDSEQLHAVTLAPFLLARHEVTRAQWQRLTTTHPFLFQGGAAYEDDAIPIGPTHPAEWIDWNDANRWLERYGMCLPTEAQWEYGCRAGTTTPWWPGATVDALAGCANLHDLRSQKHHTQFGDPLPFDDGFGAISPVGSLRANAYGLYDVHGNVAEWCRDWYEDYGRERAGDGLREPFYRDVRTFRGGSCTNPAANARSAQRDGGPPTQCNFSLGLRAARALRR